MGRKLLYDGFETCFGRDCSDLASNKGCWDPIAKTHLKSRFCAILERGSDVMIVWWTGVPAGQ